MDQELANKWLLAQERYRGTIHTFAKNSAYKLPSYSEEDVEQELLVVLWRCVLNYDPNRGASFNTLFQGSCKNRIISLINYEQAQKRQPPAGVVSLDEETTRLAIDHLLTDFSAEETCLGRLQIAEFMDELGFDEFWDLMVDIGLAYEEEDALV